MFLVPVTSTERYMVRRLREELPEADVVTLPGIGHYPQIEDPAAVMRAYLEFRAGLAMILP